MIDESLLKSAVAGRDGFTWWIGRVAHPSVWYKENHALAGKGKDSHRCKVRIIGYHPWDATDLAEEDLPWAHVMMDATTGSVKVDLEIVKLLLEEKLLLVFSWMVMKHSNQL